MNIKPRSIIGSVVACIVIVVASVVGNAVYNSINRGSTYTGTLQLADASDSILLDVRSINGHIVVVGPPPVYSVASVAVVDHPPMLLGLVWNDSHSCYELRMMPAPLVLGPAAK